METNMIDKLLKGFFGLVSVGLGLALLVWVLVA